MLKKTQIYMQTSVSTVGQGEILILLYNAAIKFLTQAREKIREKDVAAKGILISKALDIINELDSSINMEAGGSLAENLHQLYFVCSTRLLRANVSMDIEALDSVLATLTGLRDAYAQIVNTPEAKAASARIAAKLPANAIMPQRSVPLPKQGILPKGSTGRPQVQAAYTHTAVMPPQNDQTGRSDKMPVAHIQPELQSGVKTVASSEENIRQPEMGVNPVINPVSLENRRSAAAARYGKIAQSM